MSINSIPFGSFRSLLQLSSMAPEVKGYFSQVDGREPTEQVIKQLESVEKLNGLYKSLLESSDYSTNQDLQQYAKLIKNVLRTRYEPQENSLLYSLPQEIFEKILDYLNEHDLKILFESGKRFLLTRKNILHKSNCAPLLSKFLNTWLCKAEDVAKDAFVNSLLMNEINERRLLITSLDISSCEITNERLSKIVQLFPNITDLNLGKSLPSDTAHLLSTLKQLRTVHTYFPNNSIIKNLQSLTPQLLVQSPSVISILIENICAIERIQSHTDQLFYHNWQRDRQLRTLWNVNV